jgi:hypothetical protein
MYVTCTGRQDARMPGCQDARTSFRNRSHSNYGGKATCSACANAAQPGSMSRSSGGVLRTRHPLGKLKCDRRYGGETSNWFCDLSCMSLAQDARMPGRKGRRATNQPGSQPPTPHTHPPNQDRRSANREGRRRTHRRKCKDLNLTSNIEFNI